MENSHTDNNRPTEHLQQLFGSGSNALQFLDASPICTTVVDLDFNLKYMNSAGLKDLNIDDITVYYGKPYPFSFYPELFQSQMNDGLLKAKLHGVAVSQEGVVYDTQGNEQHLLSTITPVKNDGGEVESIMIVSTDITVQKKEQYVLQQKHDHLEAQVESCAVELKNSEQRFAVAMQAPNDGMWDWDLETDTVYYSPRWKKLLGYEEGELDNVLDTFVRLTDPHDVERVLGMARDYIAGKTSSFEAEMTMHHKGGHNITVISRACLVRSNVDNKPIRLIGTHENITEKKKSEQFILGRSEILKMIALREPKEIIYDAIALLYESRHPRMRCSMLILEGDKLMHAGAPSLPKEYCDAVNGLEIGPGVGSCGAATYSGRRVVVEDIATDPKWDTIKHVALPHGMRSCWSEPIKNSKGEVLGAFAMYYNYPGLPNEAESADMLSAARLAGIIMEWDKSEKDNRALEKQLRESNKLEAIGTLAGGIAHNFNNILAAILGYAEMAREESPRGSSVAQDLDQVIDAGNRGKELVKQILSFSQQEESDCVSFLPATSVEETLKMLRSTTPSRIEIIEDIDSHAGPVFADPNQFIQVLVNLCTNAYQVLEETGGDISVSLKEVSLGEEDVAHEPGVEAGSFVRLSVSDTGTGISSERKAKIFDPFFTTKEVGKGTGMGLSIVHGIVKNYRGFTTFESEIDKGTAFHVFLPIDTNSTSTALEMPVTKKEMSSISQ